MALDLNPRGVYVYPSGRDYFGKSTNSPHGPSLSPSPKVPLCILISHPALKPDSSTISSRKSPFNVTLPPSPAKTDMPKAPGNSDTDADDGRSAPETHLRRGRIYNHETIVHIPQPQQWLPREFSLKIHSYVFLV